MNEETAMKRKIYEDLLKWKNSTNRKPLIINGARQVGKTWILKDFGKNEYENVAYVNCDNNQSVASMFTDYDTDRMIRVFSALSGERVVPEKTLLIIDEIQEVPQALTALKYFCENAPEYHVAAAGSLLGLSVHEGSGYPVGKTDEISLYPLSFNEFLLANRKDILVEQIEAHRWDELSLLSNVFIDQLRQYYFVGGMPEVVDCYVNTADLLKTRGIQKRILQDYRRDFSKHIPTALLSKVNMVWDSIPAQLDRENKKFTYSMIKKGSRAKEFEDALQWLADAGLVHKAKKVSKVAAPLKHYEQPDDFKLFINDLGLLGAMADVPARKMLVDDSVFSEYKGSFTEQYVFQQTISCGIESNYYTNENSTMEIDFVVQMEDVHPIEVKAKENVKSKSLKTLIDKNPGLVGWRFSMKGYRDQDWMINVPLYLVEEWIRNHKEIT